MTGISLDAILAEERRRGARISLSELYARMRDGDDLDGDDRSLWRAMYETHPEPPGLTIGEWRPPGEAGRPPPRHTASLGATRDWTFHHRLSRHDRDDPIFTGVLRKTMAEHAQRFAQRCGYVISGTANWELHSRTDPLEEEIVLTVQMTERLDGVWGEIRHAIREDEADRAQARA